MKSDECMSEVSITNTFNSDSKAGLIVDRSYSFSLRIVNLCKELQEDKIGRILMNQLIRSGTSIGANVEEAQGSPSKKDFAYKMSIALKECRETLYWLRIIRDCEIFSTNRLSDIIDECSQIRNILTSILITTNRSLQIKR